jgi:hypothetical protein
VVKEPTLPKHRDVQKHTGQTALPVLELDDGRWIREESKDLRRRSARASFPSRRLAA